MHLPNYRDFTNILFVHVASYEASTPGERIVILFLLNRWFLIKKNQFLKDGTVVTKPTMQCLIKGRCLHSSDNLLFNRGSSRYTIKSKITDCTFRFQSHQD